MSIASKLQKLETDIANAYNKIAEKGGTIPQNKNTNNLADAIESLFAYTELEYIESTGTQYIDTGIIPNLNTRIKAEFNYGQAPSSSQIIFGCKNVSSNYYQIYKNISGNDTFISIGFGIDNVNNSTTVTKNFENKNIILDINKNDFSINNESYSYRVNPTSDGFNSLGIFARHNPSDWSLASAIKLYNFKIYNNNSLVRYFIPVKDKNNVVCLYDKVSKTFFYNQGTGDFIAGPEV